MKRDQTAARIARRLRDAEKDIDQACLSANALVQSMIEGRSDAGMAAEVGQDALEHVVSGLGALTNARRQVVAGHAALLAVAEAKKMIWRLDGPLEEKNLPLGVVALRA